MTMQSPVDKNTGRLLSKNDKDAVTRGGSYLLCLTGYACVYNIV